MSTISYGYIIFGLTILLTIKASVQSIHALKKINVEAYLLKYGYLPHNFDKSLYEGSVMGNAIKDFQSFAGLKPSGVLDKETMEMMSTPRCGVPDKGEIVNSNRLKRYATVDNPWPVKDLTYKISIYPKSMLKDVVNRIIFRAFAVWSEYTDLTFTQRSSGSVNIDIIFVEGYHGDGDPFDGPGRILAHAYYPQVGDAHFDDAETWTIRGHRGINLFQLATHEFGHSLGLLHSNVRSAVMASFYRGYDPDYKLVADDIFAIQSLYGAKSSQGGNGGESLPRPRRKSLLCEDPNIDAIFNSVDGHTYAFKGNIYFELTANSVADTHPKLISHGWPGLEDNIDAAFTYDDGKTYFFKGDKYWRYHNRNKDFGYPKKISEHFHGVPNNLNAAIAWKGTKTIYFFKGEQFWRFNPFRIPTTRSTNINIYWKGVPNYINAAIQYVNGDAYFFQGNTYYRFSASSSSVGPLSAAKFFGC